MGIKRLNQPVVWRSITSGQVGSDVGLPGEPIIQWSSGVPYVRIMDGVTPGGTIVAEGMAGGINTPTIISPPPGMVDVSTTPIFTSSAFVGVSSDAGATHIFSLWEISLSVDFTDLAFFSGTDATSLTTLDLATKGWVLEYGTTYYVHVKYGSSSGKVSDWSPTLEITTANTRLLLQTGKLVGKSSVSGAYFGYAVDISHDGSVMVVGAQGDSYSVSRGGSASIIRLVSNEWTIEDILTASDLSSGDFYGYRVAISGDGSVVAIASPLATHKATQAGAVYLYRYQNNRWTEIQKIIGPSPYYLDRIGVSLGLSKDGSTLAIGAGWRNHHEKYDNGSVMIYRYNGYVWDFEAELTDPGSDHYEYLGRSLSLSDDGSLLVAGAAYTDTKGAESGTVYVFQRSDSQWELTNQFHAPDAKSSLYFGESVALSRDGTRLVVGAPWGEGQDVTTGAAYCYELVEGSWVNVSKIYSDNGKNGDYYGIQVALSYNGSYLAISAYTDNGRGVREGCVFHYQWLDQDLTLIATHMASDGEGWDEFGSAIALSGDGRFLVVGSPHDDDTGSSSGAIYIYS